MSPYSTLLFARPSFLEGVARVLDFGDTLNVYNASLTPQQADEIALRADWAAVGRDLWDAVDQMRDEVAEGEE